MPFNRKEKAVITNGPGEELHTDRSAEAIDFGARALRTTPTPGVIPTRWSEIRAAKSGTVYIRKRYDALGWGNLVVIQHNDGLYSYYAHLKNPGLVGVGTPVAKGDPIGTMGNTGCVNYDPPCGVHIHFEVRDGMSGGNPSTGSSADHWARNLLGMGWFPWYITPNLNSGFVITSPSHPIGVCLRDNTIEIQWLALDEFSHGNQLDGYSFKWSQLKTDYPDRDKDIEETAIGLVSNPIPITSTPTEWFFHLRAKKNDPSPTGGWAQDWEVAHQGPFLLGTATGCQQAPSPSDWESTFDDDP